jgi:hypothetical protein
LVASVENRSTGRDGSEQLLRSCSQKMSSMRPLLIYDIQVNESGWQPGRSPEHALGI